MDWLFNTLKPKYQPQAKLYLQKNKSLLDEFEATNGELADDLLNTGPVRKVSNV